MLRLPAHGRVHYLRIGEREEEKRREEKSMAMVRERRNQQSVRLQLPPSQQPLTEIGYRFQLPSPPLDGSPDSTLVVSDLEKLSVVGHGGGGTVYKVRCRHTSSPSRSSASIGTPSTPGSRRLARSIF